MSAQNLNILCMTKITIITIYKHVTTRSPISVIQPQICFGLNVRQFLARNRGFTTPEK